MSQENVETVRRCGEAFDRGDYQALAAIDPEIEYDLSHFPEGRVYHGHDGVREACRIWLGTWDAYGQERIGHIDARDQVVVIVPEHGRGKGSGLEGRTRGLCGMDASEWEGHTDPLLSEQG
jgi:hypothetical protein